MTDDLQFAISPEQVAQLPALVEWVRREMASAKRKSAPSTCLGCVYDAHCRMLTQRRMPVVCEIWKHLAPRHRQYAACVPDGYMMVSQAARFWGVTYSAARRHLCLLAKTGVAIRIKTFVAIAPDVARQHPPAHAA